MLCVFATDNGSVLPEMKRQSVQAGPLDKYLKRPTDTVPTGELQFFLCRV